MLQEGHIGVGLLLASPFALIAIVLSQPALAVIVYAGAIIGSGLPDIDQYIGIVKHRGFTHTIYFAILTGIVSAYISFFLLQTISIDELIAISSTEMILYSVAFGLANLFGILTHLVGDMVTPAGIRPFHPVSPRNILPVEVSDKKYVRTFKKNTYGDSRNANDDMLNNVFLGVGLLAMIITVVIGSYTMFMI